MNNRYTDCPECGHHRSTHSEEEVPFPCNYVFIQGPMSGKEVCQCQMTQVQIDKHIASFDDRTCILCGLGGVKIQNGSGWSHKNMHECLRVMGEKIKNMEREMFSRIAAIRYQKERKMADTNK